MIKCKGRMIRRDVSKSQKIASLSRESLVLFYMILPHLNSYGKLNGSPYFIKGEIVPLLNWFTLPLIEKCLKEITKKTNLKWFECDGLFYLHSLSWEEHQELERNKRGKDDLPSFNQVVDKSPTSPDLLLHEVEVEVEVEDKGQGEVESIYCRIISDLNEVTGHNYRVTDDVKRLVSARVTEKFTFEDFQIVHRTMQGKWAYDPSMQQYLRPQTLYSTKFQSYLNQKITLSDKGIISKQSEKGLQAFENWNKDGKGVFGAQSDDI